MKENQLLSALQPGQQAVVKSILEDSSMRRRLQDLGLTPGTPVTCVLKSPLGDPAAYLIRGAVIALRCEDSRQIQLN